jgi:hypothetical protein
MTTNSNAIGSSDIGGIYRIGQGKGRLSDLIVQNSVRTHVYL